jgi:hypothetical protein
MSEMEVWLIEDVDGGSFEYTGTRGACFTICQKLWVLSAVRVL